MTTAPTHPLRARQLERLPIALERAGAKIATVAHTDDSAVLRLVKAARAARSATQRVIWMHRAASAWGAPMASLAACRPGCSACCHMPVTITKAEAELLSRATGRPMRGSLEVRSPEGADETRAALQSFREGPVGVPCPFLVAERCSAYEARPTACRVLWNLDDDPLLCQHAPTGPVDVPYADATAIRGLALSMEPDLVLGDIRDFFA